MATVLRKVIVFFAAVCGCGDGDVMVVVIGMLVVVAGPREGGGGLLWAPEGILRAGVTVYSTGEPIDEYDDLPGVRGEAGRENEREERGN